MTNTQTISPLKLTESHRLEAEARQCIAGFTQTMMKKPEQFCQGRFPVYLAQGQGAEVTDVDGNHYIDFICGLGANALGHNHPAVMDAINSHLAKGLLHSLPGALEVKTAKTLIDIIPGAEMVRFFKTGADANSAAVRLARYVTQRDKIITVGYNGWHDHYMFDTPGVPKTIAELTTRFPLFAPTDEAPLLDFVQNHGSEHAALLLSVPYTRELSVAFVQQLCALCRSQGLLFVLDEVVTGFRLALGGAQEYFGIEADLVTLSKGLAAGMPLSAVTGKRALLSQMEALQVSTTFGGELLSLAVCNAALNHYRRSQCLSHIAQLGAALKEGVNAVAKELGAPLKIVGYDAIPMFMFAPNPVEHARIAAPFVGAMAEQGILLRRDVNFICAAHTVAHIEATIAAVRNALLQMQANGVFDAASIAPKTEALA
ncbi:MAG: aminotransferase class III-fold pyridoxal phosphate-dependent enzyme [Marinagarivorans sp.]|nr:aminotransferase class III-fold pyridoxal phosphate-dependent enzyme [Marinagarivorans sp.]